MAITLTPYRRHLQKCPHRAKGQHYTLCACPIWVYGKLANGRPVRQSLSTTDWPCAAERIEILYRSDGPAPARGIAVAAGTRSFLEDCSRRNLGAGTLRSYRCTLDNFLAGRENRPLASIDPPEIDAYFAGRQVKPRTYRKELTHLRILFAWLIERGWIAQNPARRIRPPKVEDVPNLPYSPEDTASLIAACGRMTHKNPREIAYVRHRARALVLVFLYSGLRISDVARLRRMALNPASGHLTLRMTKTKAPLKVQLPPDVADMLITLPATNPDYFFWSGEGNIDLCTADIRRTVYRIGELAGIDANPHRFRDTFAVELLTQGADIRTVQMLLGHEDVRTTQRHYAHFMPVHQDLLDRATARLNFEPKAVRPVLMKPRQNRRRDA